MALKMPEHVALCFLFVFGANVIGHLTLSHGLNHRCNIFTICSGFHGIYDVDHFINALRYDVYIVESIPEIRKNGKTKKIKALQV